MREIKFRIWDKQNKNWITENGYSLHCNSNWAICPFTGKLTDYVGMDGELGETHIASPVPDYYMQGGKIVKEPRYVLMQYTGLKDKNGNLIYEGDIVQNMIIGPVEYFLGEFSIGGVTPLKDFLINTSDENQPLNFNLDLEIIGNIFETPELLK